MFFGNFFKEVGHANLSRTTTHQERCLNRCTDVVRMNVAVVQTFTTDNHDGVTNGAPRSFELWCLRIVEIKKEHHFVAQFTDVNCSIILMTFCNSFQCFSRWSR